MDTQPINLKNLDKSNWQRYRFDQIAKNISERVDPNNTDLKVYIGLEHIDSDSIHIKRSGTPDDVNGQKLRCYPGDVIFGRRRAYQRKAAIATVDGFCSAHSLVLRANPDVIEPKLFPFFLHSDLFMHRAVDISVGSLSPTINWGTLKHQEFLLPPKHQQAQLAELLWAMDEVVEKKYELSKRIEVTKISIVKSYFENASEYKKLKELGKVITGATPPTEKKEFWNGYTPFVTPSEINDLPTVNVTERFLTVEGVNKSRLIPKNSVLTVCIGSTIGKVSINVTECCTNQQINALIPKPEYHPVFILYLLRYFKSKILARTGATAVPIINKTEFESISLPVIRNDMIKKFVDELNCLDLSFNNCRDQIIGSNELQKSLINQIF